MAHVTELQFLERFIEYWTDKPATPHTALSILEALQSRLNYLILSGGRTSEKDYLSMIQHEIKRTKAQCRMSREADLMLDRIIEGIQRELADKRVPHYEATPFRTPYIREMLDKLVTDDRVPCGRVIIERGTDIGPTGTLHGAFINPSIGKTLTEEEINSLLNKPYDIFSSPKTNTAMADTKQTNTSAPMSKADKRARILQIEQGKKSLTELREKLQRTAQYNADGIYGNDYGLKIYVPNQSGHTILPSPDFMSHKTYFKLYLQEVEDQMQQWEKELDSLTA